MPKSFTIQERKTIERSLLEKGRELFSVYGLKKTTIDDITDGIGIAKGSFYNFFESKEVLYYEVFLQEEKKLRGKALMALSSGNLTAKRFKQFLVRTFQMIDQYPTIRRMYLEDEYQLLVRRLPQEYRDNHTSEDIAQLTPLIKKWQSEGKMVREDPEIITGMIRAFFVLVLHKKDLGDEYFFATIELLAESIANRLVPEKDAAND